MEMVGCQLCRPSQDSFGFFVPPHLLESPSQEDRSIHSAGVFSQDSVQDRLGLIELSSLDQ
jgi:hypothetical protein